MLHRTSKEIDEKGNVIGGELKKKCDSFIECLEEFEGEYLSDKYNPGTASGKNQQMVMNEFKKWLDKTNRQYSSERRKFENYLSELNQFKGQIHFCCEQAKKSNLDQRKIEKIMEGVFADYTKKCNKIREEYDKAYDKLMDIYNTELELYQIRIQLYSLKPSGIMPIPPVPPIRKNPKFPSEPPVPTQMTDELFDKICDVVSSKPIINSPKLSDQAKVHCKKYVEPLLEMALTHCDDLIKNNDLNNPDQIRNWFVEKADQEREANISMYLRKICSYGKMGFPIFDDKKTVPDIYWTGLFIDYSETFKKIMSKFKSDQGGSSSTKKWINKVVRSLSKKINEKTCEKQLKKYLDNLADSLKTKVPGSISKRPTIRQKPVKEKLDLICKHILEAKKHIPDFPKNV